MMCLNPDFSFEVQKLIQVYNRDLGQRGTLKHHQFIQRKCIFTHVSANSTDAIHTCH